MTYRQLFDKIPDGYLDSQIVLYDDGGNYTWYATRTSVGHNGFQIDMTDECPDEVMPELKNNRKTNPCLQCFGTGRIETYFDDGEIKDCHICPQCNGLGEGKQPIKE